MKSSKFKQSLRTDVLRKKYKAIIFDVDGTLITNHRESLPSKKVTAAINNASKKIHVGIATSRCFDVAKEIIKHLELSGPSILSGGAQVMDFPSKKELYEQPIGKNDVKQIISVFEGFNAPFLTCDGVSPDKIFNGKIPDRAFEIYGQGLEKEIADKIVSSLTKDSNISVYTVKSWTPGKIDVIISHLKSTKQHGIFEVAKILNIATDDIIGVGDGYNDFPLLMACGLKVAMGNAIDDLKQIADYVAPSVDDDGAADVIEKFVL